MSKCKEEEESWENCSSITVQIHWWIKLRNNKFFIVVFGNDDFIYKFEIDLNLFFGKLKNFKFGFGSILSLFVKVLKIKNLRMTYQILLFSNSSFMIS